VLFLTISEIGSYDLMIEISIGCDEFTVRILLHFFEAKTFEKNIDLHGFAICSDVVFSTKMCGPKD
jgi:hypothetical protein